MERVFINITSLLVIIIIGWIAGKRRYFDDSFIDGLNKFIFNISLPSLIVSSMFRKFEGELLGNVFDILIFGMIYYPILFFIYTFIAKKIYGNNESKSSIFVILMTFANVGYIGYPVIDAVLGNVGVFYTAMYNLTHGIYLWSLGILLVAKGKSLNIVEWLKANPPMIALIISFGLFALKVEVPSIISIPFETLGKTATPLALFVVGSGLSKVKVLELFDRESLIMTSIKLLVVPSILALVLAVLDMKVEVKMVLLIISAMPCGVNSVIIAKNYRADDKLATKVLFVSTISLFISIYYIVFVLAKLL